MTLEDHLLGLPTPPVLDVLRQFVHLPNARTGTTSIDEGPLRGRCIMQHRDRDLWATAWRRVATSDPVFFTFVRNPWDRVCSAFFQCRDRAKSAENKIDPKWEFTDWVKQVLAVEWPNVNRHFAEQYPTAYFNGKRIGFVGRFERMADDWRELASLIGVTQRLPHVNGSGHGRYVDHYDDEAREIIGRLHQSDVDAFGYEFGV